MENESFPKCWIPIFVSGVCDIKVGNRLAPFFWSLCPSRSPVWNNNGSQSYGKFPNCVIFALARSPAPVAVAAIRVAIVIAPAIPVIVHIHD